MSDDRPEWSLYIEWPESTRPVLRFEPLHRVMVTARALIERLRANEAADVVQPLKVIITDGGDDTALEWRPAEGVVFPADGAVRKYFE